MVITQEMEPIYSYSLAKISVTPLQPTPEF